MSYEALLRQRADIYRPTNDAPVGPEARAIWPTTPTQSSVRCNVQQLQAKEQDAQTGAVISTHNSFWEYGVDLLEKDRIVVNGVTYDVQGVNADVAGAGHHAEAMLKAVT